MARRFLAKRYDIKHAQNYTPTDSKRRALHSIPEPREQNMKFQRILFLSVATTVWACYLPVGGASTAGIAAEANTKPASNPSKDSDLTPAKRDSAVGKSSNSSRGGISDVLGCMAKRLSSDEGHWGHCYEVFLTYWNTAGQWPDSGIGETEKSKKKRWDVQTLMLGASVKLLLFLPIFAILTGKAISLSLTSFLVTALTFLFRAQTESLFGRSDSKESSRNDFFMR